MDAPHIPGSVETVDGRQPTATRPRRSGPRRQDILRSQEGRVVVAHDVLDFTSELPQPSEDLAVAFPVELEGFVLDGVAQVDDEVRPRDLVHLSNELAQQLRSQAGEFPELPEEASVGPEMDVGDDSNRDVHQADFPAGAGREAPTHGGDWGTRGCLDHSSVSNVEIVAA